MPINAVTDPTAIRGATDLMNALEMACQMDGTWATLMTPYMFHKYGGAMRFDYSNSNFSTIYRSYGIGPVQHEAWLKVCERAEKLGLRVTEGKPQRRGKVAKKLGYPSY